MRFHFWYFRFMAAWMIGIGCLLFQTPQWWAGVLCGSIGVGLWCIADEILADWTAEKCADELEEEGE